MAIGLNRYKNMLKDVTYMPDHYGRTEEDEDYFPLKITIDYEQILGVGRGREWSDNDDWNSN